MVPFYLGKNNEWNAQKSGKSSLHLCAKGGVVPPSVLAGVKIKYTYTEL
jgi:hypothetical protein